MKPIFRYAVFAMFLGAPVGGVALGCGRVDDGVTEPAEASTLDGPFWPTGDGSRAEGGRPRPSEEQWPGSCEPPNDAGRRQLCDFGFACVYPREDGPPDAAPEPGCGSREGAEACGGFWCGRGCRCKDPVAKVCACQ